MPPPSVARPWVLQLVAGNRIVCRGMCRATCMVNAPTNRRLQPGWCPGSPASSAKLPTSPATTRLKNAMMPAAPSLARVHSLAPCHAMAVCSRVAQTKETCGGSAVAHPVKTCKSWWPVQPVTPYAQSFALSGTSMWTCKCSKQCELGH